MWSLFSRPAPKGPSRRGFRPQVEALEERWCPSGGVMEWSDPLSNGVTGSVALAVYPAGTADAGKIVSVGTGQTASANAISILRLNGDGTIDTSFNGTGSELLKVGAYATGYAVAIQPDGKILVGGTAYATIKDVQTYYQDEFVVARLNPDGSLDKTFANRGVFTWDASSNRDEIDKLAVLADGSVIAAGGTWGGAAVLKLTAGGKLVSSFGSGGLAVFNPPGGSFSTSTIAAGLAMAVAPNGDVILGGNAGTPNSGLLAAINATTGQLDTAFNGQGFLEIDPTGYYATYFNAVAVQGNNIIVAGETQAIGGLRTGLAARFSLAGALDTTFGSGGYYLTTADFRAAAFSNAALEADGSVVVTGVEFPTSNTSQWYVGHLSADGQLDTTFGGAGTGYAMMDGTMIALAIDPLTGDIIVGGRSLTSPSGTNQYFIARLTHP